jgi:hypothetical protein
MVAPLKIFLKILYKTLRSHSVPVINKEIEEKRIFKRIFAIVALFS